MTHDSPIVEPPQSTTERVSRRNVTVAVLSSALSPDPARCGSSSPKKGTKKDRLHKRTNSNNNNNNNSNSNSNNNNNNNNNNSNSNSNNNNNNSNNNNNNNKKKKKKKCAQVYVATCWIASFVGVFGRRYIPHDKKGTTRVFQTY